MTTSRSTTTMAALLALAVLAAGCVVSPQPSPPLDEPSIDDDGFSVIDTSAEDANTLLSFSAAPGTVDPPEGVVIVTNLENDDAPSVASVGDDGSFTIALAGLPTDVVRFQVKQALRSQPIDLAIDATAQAISVIDDTPGCFVVEPARYLPLDGAGDTRSVVLRNECEASVRIAATRLRRGQGSFTFSPTDSLTIEPGDVSFITVRVEGSQGEVEDVLFLDLLEPEVTRRAITLTVPDP